MEQLLFTTCDFLEGYRVTEQLGLVFGDVVFKTGLINAISATAKNLTDILIHIGDREMSGTAKMLKNAREYALDILRQEAEKKGANAVIGIECKTACGIDGLIQINFSGTAVIVEKNNRIELDSIEESPKSRSILQQEAQALLKTRLIYAKDFYSGENLRKELVSIYRDTLSPSIKSVLDRPDSCLTEALEKLLSEME